MPKDKPKKIVVLSKKDFKYDPIVDRAFKESFATLREKKKGK